MISRAALVKKAIGGVTGQMLLRFLGYDAFVATKDVAACLRTVGLDIAAAPTSKRDLAKIQEPACPTGICRSSAPCRWARLMRDTGMALIGADRMKVKPLQSAATSRGSCPRACRVCGRVIG